jgi:NodT family efflux transporter outer membrane factor (OMF) lipoprotein
MYSYPTRLPDETWTRAKRLARTAAPPVVLVLLLFLLPACYTVGPDYVPPEPDLPDAWHEAATEGLADGQTNLHTWWTVLEDPILNDLIQRAGAGNLTLKSAVARIDEAMALRGVATGELYPQIRADTQVDKGRLSKNGLGAVLPDRSNNFYHAGVSGTWEIDLWGRIRRAVESADASLQASVEDYRDILVLLFAEVATTYIDVRALQARVAAAEANAKAQRDTLKLTEDRFKAGLAPALDIAQAKLNLASSESLIPALRIGLQSAINRLAVLIGEYPGVLQAALDPVKPVPVPPEEIAVGIPTNLLRQRPDIRGAERRLAAQTARIGVATAELYPRLTLNGSISLDSRSSTDWFSQASTAWIFSPNLSWNIFNGGRIRAQIRAEDARTDQALLDYRSSLLFAVEDVENAMVAYKREKTRRAALARAVDAAQESVRLVLDLYKTGVTSFQRVLDSERALFTRQDEFAQSNGQVTKNLVNLYRALGGGWDPEAAARDAKELKAAEAGAAKKDAPSEPEKSAPAGPEKGADSEAKKTDEKKEGE